jgi:hypothetical protein
MKLGINLTQVTYWNDDMPFLDRMKGAGPWNPAAPVLQVDANGWPTKISGPATTYVPMTDVPTDYTIRWEGKGAFKLTRNYKPTITGPNSLTVTSASLPGNGSEVPSNALVITEIDPTDPIRNISIVETRHDALHQSGEILNPDFIAKLIGYGQLRFMDWLRANTDRSYPTMSQRSWFSGVPLEVCLLTARQAGARAWVNMHHLMADAEMIAFALACPPDADIEWSNEATWNTQYASAAWVTASAAAAGIDRGEWAGKHHARIAKLLETVGRKLVVGYQPTTNAKGWDKYTKALIEGGATSANVSRVMTSCYPTGDLTSVSALTPFMKNGDVAGVAAALLKDVTDKAPARFAVAKALADKLGAPWSVYEGNVAHLNTSRTSDACVPFIDKVQRDPAMRAIGEKMLGAATAAGCEVFNVFDMSSPASRSGFFGIKGTPFGEVVETRRLAKPVLADAKPQSALPDELTIEGRLYRAVGV